MKLRIVMMGTGTFARPTFEALLTDATLDVVGLVTQPDREGSKERGSTRQTGKSLKEIAVERSIPVIQPVSINTPEGIETLRLWRPDLLVVAAYGQILRNEVLQSATQGGINVHGSLLPRFRGAAPVAYAILTGDATTGVTIIRMTTGLDAGEMLARAETAIRPDETAGELEARLAPLGASLAIETAHRMIAGPVTGIRQDPALVTKAPKLTKESGLIVWSRSPAEICRHIRAMQPWPTAYTFLHQTGKPPLRMIVTKAAEHPGGVSSGQPGRVSVEQPGKLLVETGKGCVELLEVQPAGKARMNATDFLRGRRLGEADRFGSEQL